MRAALEQLVATKGQFGPEAAEKAVGALEKLLRARLRDTQDLIRLHETALFARAYPQSSQVVKLSDELLFAFAGRMAQVPSEGFDDPEISGIAGTSLSTAFSHDFASRLVARHSDALQIDWDAWDRPDRLGPVLASILPSSFEDWSVEPHIDWRQWFQSADVSLGWLLANVAPAQYDSLEIPLAWTLGSSCASRSRTRIPRNEIYIHDRPLLRRSDVSIPAAFASPRIPAHRLPPAEANHIVDVIVDTSAVRYRELWGFCHPNVERVYHADFGRGVDFFFFGVPNKWRLPFRAYDCGMYFKNGVPIGYFEGLSFFERMEMGFNLYYTFREGETAWLYAQTMKLFREQRAVDCFTVDPYQLGHENEEAVASGAYWFYRKLGFQPVTPEIRKLSASEERRIGARPGYRSPPQILRRLASMPLVYGNALEWGQFSLHKAAQAIERGDGRTPWAALIAATGVSLDEAQIRRAKNAPEESGYLRQLQQSPKLRRKVLELGTL
jgi:hypothetical protein